MGKTFVSEGAAAVRRLAVSSAVLKNSHLSGLSESKEMVSEGLTRTGCRSPQVRKLQMQMRLCWRTQIILCS